MTKIRFAMTRSGYWLQVGSATLAFVISSCASVRTYHTLEQPSSGILTTSVGGVIFRLNRTGDLPNALGNADLLGGKVEKGSRRLG